MKKDFLEILAERDMVYDIIPETKTQLDKEMTIGYIGFDATAPSLHVGNLATIMLLKLFQLAGHKPIALIGGATTMIGDPGGKKAERVLMKEEDIRENEQKIKKQLSKFLSFDSTPNSAQVLNNYEWFKDFKILDFLRDVGKHISISYMTSKESVKTRIGTGLSFAEFSYQLLQGYDFYHLYKHKGVKLQMGGSDQWGNLTTGLELIRRKENGQAFAVTTPLLTKEDGSKFGKTESGSIWLDPTMTTPYKFYQFWINCSDIDIEKYIKVFSLKNIHEIHELVSLHKKEPHKRILQKSLAEELTKRIHSNKDYENAINATDILFSKNIDNNVLKIDEKTLLDVFEDLPKFILNKNDFETLDLMTLLTDKVNFKIFSSKGEYKRSIQNKSIYINKQQVFEKDVISNYHLILNKYLILQKGKKNYFLLIFE